MNYTIEGLQDLMASILQRAGNNPDEKVKPAELKLIFDYFLDLQQAMIAAGLATAAATAGSEQKSIPGGVNTVALENLPLSTGAGAVVTGYPLQIGSTLLLPAQTNKIENGVYEVTAEGLKRLEGYDTASGLSRVNVAVQNGDRAGDIYQQPNTLANDNAEKNFNYVSNQSEALKALASSLIEETKTDYIDFDGTYDADDNFTPSLEYIIGDVVKTFTLKEVWKRGPSIEKSLKDSEWTYDAVTGKLTLQASAVSNMRKAEEYELKLVMSTRGTEGMAYGVKLKTAITQDGPRLLYRRSNQTDAELEDAGPIPDGSTAAFRTITIANATNATIVNHDLNTDNLDIVVKNAQGRGVAFVNAFPVNTSQIGFSIPEGETFTGKLLITAYPETITI